MALRSRREEHLAFLRVCEDVAKEFPLPLDFQDYAPEDVERLPGAFAAWALNKGCQDARYFAKQAAARWTPEFLNAISHATSMRVAKPPAPLHKGDGHRCMACGRPEQTNALVLDLAGPRREYADTWLGGDARTLADAFEAFMDDYEASKKEAGRVVAQLMPVDMGSYALGACCLRKAQLFFWFSTLPLLHVYDAAAVAADCDEKEIETYVYATDELAEEHEDRMDSLRACLVDDRRAVPVVPSDRAFWSLVDRGRRSAAEGLVAEEAASATLRAALLRGKDTLRGKASEGEQSEVEVEVVDGQAASESDDVEDEEEEEEDDDEAFVPNGAQRGAKRRRVVRDDGDDAPPSDPPPPPPPSMFTARQYAQHQRRADRIPARRETVRRLYDLAARLSQEAPSRLEDSVLVGQAAATIVELAEKAGASL